MNTYRRALRPRSPEEIVEHHEQVIRNLDLEKLTLLNQRGSHY